MAAIFLPPFALAPTAVSAWRPTPELEQGRGWGERSGFPWGFCPLPLNRPTELCFVPGSARGWAPGRGGRRASLLGQRLFPAFSPPPPSVLLWGAGGRPRLPPNQPWDSAARLPCARGWADGEQEALALKRGRFLAVWASPRMPSDPWVAWGEGLSGPGLRRAPRVNPRRACPCLQVALGPRGCWWLLVSGGVCVGGARWPSPAEVALFK